MDRKRPKLGKLLLESGLISEADLKAALCYQKHRRCLLGASLVKLGYLSEDVLLDLLERKLGIERVDLDSYPIEAEVLSHVPAEWALAYTAFPLDRCELQGAPGLRVAMSDPTNLTVVDAVEFMTGFYVQPLLASESAIHRAIQRWYDPLPASLAAQSCPLDKNSEESASYNQKVQKLIDVLKTKGILSDDDLEQLN
jgi:type IV pilus assembly protein PilB